MGQNVAVHPPLSDTLKKQRMLSLHIDKSKSGK